MCRGLTTVFIISSLFTFGFFALSFVKFKHNMALSFPGCAAVLCLIALSLRLYVTYTTEGFTSDMNCFQHWGSMVASDGLDRMYYHRDMFLDYPPGYLYVLWGCHELSRFLNFWPGMPESKAVFALVPMLSDIICGIILMVLAKKKMGGFTALFVGAAYLFCPAVIINSAQWGQVDSFCTMLLLISILFLYYEKWIPCGIFYGLSAISKPQMFTFIPVYLFFVLRQRKKVKPLVLGVGSGLFTMMAVSYPFVYFDFGRIVDLYKECMGGYKFYSVNAYNIWTLLGMNWRDLPPEGIHNIILTIAAPIVAVILCGLLFLSKKKDVVFAAPVLIMTFVFCFAVKQHERYMFPVMVFALVCYIYSKNIKQFWSFLLLSLCSYLNVGHIFSLFKGGHWQGDMNSVGAKVFSALTLVSLLFVIYSDIVTYFDWRGLIAKLGFKKQHVSSNLEDRFDSDNDNNAALRDGGVLASGGQADASDMLEPEGGRQRDTVHGAKC